jgi:geranylgeranyl pyrophosphate synthase
MDDDDIRRGRPTTHCVYGVATAAVAGAAMVPLAAAVAANAARALGLPWPVCGAIVRELMRASGAGGMVGGQLLDLRGEGQSPTLAELEVIHRAKTGALIAAAVRIGAMAAGADERRLSALARFGDAVGLAFQIADDILDATGSTGQLGKTAGRDAELGKSTYVAHVGVDGARAHGMRLIDHACDALQQAGVRTPALEYLARSTLTRAS